MGLVRDRARMVPGENARGTAGPSPLRGTVAGGWRWRMKRSGRESDGTSIRMAGEHDHWRADA